MMHLGSILIVLAAITASGAAVRSTWSPCGLSMLSSLTPFGERSRGHRYATTATWFLLGATAGGATLGLVVIGLTILVSAAGVDNHPVAAASIAATIALAGAATDAGLFGSVIPVVRRQVDDRWLNRYRAWVYAGGFGWQIGNGVTTYVMTSGVFVFVALGALSAMPVAGFFTAMGFGAARGAAVLLTSRASDPSALRVLHRNLERAAEPVRRASIGAQVLSALVAAAYIGPVVSALFAALTVTAARMARSQETARVVGK